MIGTASTGGDGSLTLPVVIPSTAASSMTYSIGLLGGASAGFGAVSYTVTSTPTAARAGQLSVRRAGNATVRQIE